MRDKQDTLATKEELAEVKRELNTKIDSVKDGLDNKIDVLSSDMQNMFRHTQIMFVTAIGAVVAVLAYIASLLNR